MIRSLARRCVTLWITTAAIAACSGRQEAPKVPLGTSANTDGAAGAAHALIGPAAKIALDSGNALFRRKAYDAALTQYRTAASLAPQHAAPLFGIYMVARATNQTAMADTALTGIRLRNGPTTAVPHTLTNVP